MDFLTLFGIYVLVVLACIALVCKYSGKQQSPFHTLFNFITKILAPVTPKWLQKWSQKSMHSLFHEREMETALTSLCVPYVLLIFKTCFFYLCISKDPGTVTKKRVVGQVSIYQYDRRMFHPGVHCPTCQLVKPARSKHCRVCDRCVHRFDHHCVWVNNCIGALNTRYFLLYLFSVCAMAGDIALLTTDMLLHVVLRSGLLGASYIDEYDQQQPAGFLFVIQHLFMSFPRIIFMLGFLVFVFFLLGGYALFHSYLALVNQTSNEWYKSRGYFCQHCHPASAVDPLKTPVPEHSKRYFYSHGILRNLGEIFFPPRLPKRKVN
ncbi:palmitoyltransferase ZDHHC4 isoform X2 [Cynoglossus semilaevis]|uniref:palmitoyltransferase ZDHHC4 isoform X2 n=1 Tax=Cynoglossus semilaevis TaxID=244447 RepID=UPI000D623E59|nr:probable palmitoyltransferase ZDHHC4 isoform X2 [Cynoglossus semilaevis]